MNGVAPPTRWLLDSIRTPADLRRLPDNCLQDLADEVRGELIEVVSHTGGHLGAGLGVVELTVALHHVFDTPDDILIWDVGHQAYPHKILTGRRDRMRTLRQGGGLSGFTRRSESAFDPFGAAHAATSISAALGFAVARDQSGARHRIVAVIGDGSIGAGMAYEAMNAAAETTGQLTVILNDNEMSIAPPVGAVSAHLCDLAGGRAVAPMFEAMGFDYVGPVDGHDLEALLPALRLAHGVEARPVLVHVKTCKGKGYAPAEHSADRYHGVARFNVVTGVQDKPKAGPPAYQTVFGQTLAQLAETDPKIIGVTAAMPAGTGLDIFGRRFPERMFDVGIAEQHAVTFAAGLAADGYRPFCAIYSTFLQRGYDQVVHDVAIQKLPVRFALDRAGLVGADGATHAGSFDIGYLGALPGFVVMAAADEAELARMVATQALLDEGPSSVRYPRGEGTGAAIPSVLAPLEIGRGRVVREGSSVALLSFGARLTECLVAADKLGAMGLSVTVADARFAKPLDEDLIRRLAREHEVLLTVEEGAMGGFGAFVLHFLARDGLLDRGLKVRTLTLPDVFQEHDKPEAMYAKAGLDSDGVFRAALVALGRPATAVPERLRV